MAQYLESYLLRLSKRNFAQHTLMLIKAKNTSAFLSLVSSLLEHPTQQNALIPIYPKIASYSKRIWTPEIESFPLRATVNTVLNNINIGYINHVGCNCGKKINPLYLPNELITHMTCPCFIKNIMLHLPITFRKKIIFYLDTDYQHILSKNKDLSPKTSFSILHKV